MIHLGTKDTLWRGKMQELVKMPHLGETMEEGRIVDIYVKEGDYVKKGDLIFETETDKTTLTVESFKEGYVRKVFVNIGDTVRVGEPVLLLASSKDEPIEFSEEGLKNKIEKEDKKVEDENNEIKDVEIEEKKEKILATPLAKKIAKEHGVDLALIAKGKDKIKREDVEAYIKKKESEEIPLSSLRRAIGEKMSISKREIPHFYLTLSVDMEKVRDLKETLNSTKNLKLSYTDFIIKALSISLLKYKNLNAHFKKEGLKVFDSVNIGVALDKGDSLIVPVIHDVEKKDIVEIEKERHNLVDKALSGKLTPFDMEGATFTISNLGPYNIEKFSAIINPPQVGILAIGKIKDTPLAVDGQVRIKPVLKVTLSADHRAIDGAYGAKFLNYFKEILENPILIWAY